MDPVSIAAAVGPTLKTLYSVTTTLYTFITSAKKVDKSLENLQSEVRGLTRVLEDIETFLKDVIIAQTRNSTPGIDGAWGPIYNAIRDTRHTIKALQKVLDRLGSPSEVTNGIKKTVKQIQLNINSDEINSIRSRIQWHSTSLQLALQMATLAINCLTNDNLINVINPKIDGILPLVPKIEGLIEQVENLSSQLTDKFAGLPEDFQKSKITENTQQLKRTAEAVIITASTVIESQSTVVDRKDRQQPSSSGSGQFPDELREHLVDNWISHLTVDQEEIEPDSDIISELMPDDSVSCVALKQNKRSQQINEAGTPASSPDTTKNVGSPTYVSTGGERSTKDVVGEGSTHLNPFEETSSSSEDLNTDTVSMETRTAYRADHKVDASYNEKSAKELLAVLGIDPEVKGWKVNDTLFDLAKMKAGKGVRSSSNMVETLLYLLEKGGDVNSMDTKLKTPLYHASREGNTAVVELLVERDADTNMRNQYGWTALHIAACKGHTPVVEVLLKAGTDIECKTRDKGSTPLAVAAHKGQELTVERLLKAGALVNARDKYASTPLHHASAHGHVEVVEMLLKAGASVNSKNVHDNIPLHTASAGGHAEVVETLLKAGASVDLKNKHGRTSLIHTAYYGHKTTIELLLAAGADINTRAISGRTVLHEGIFKHDKDHSKSRYLCAICACSETRENIVRLLCEKGADPSVRDNKGVSPLSMLREHCSEKEREALTRVLKSFGAV